MGEAIWVRDITSISARKAWSRSHISEYKCSAQARREAGFIDSTCTTTSWSLLQLHVLVSHNSLWKKALSEQSCTRIDALKLLTNNTIVTKSTPKNVGNDSWFSMCTYMDCNNTSTQDLASFWFNQSFYFLTWYCPTLILSIHSVNNWFFFPLCFCVALSRITSSFANTQPIALHSTPWNRFYYPHFTAAEQRHRAASTKKSKCPLIPDIWTQFVWVFCSWVFFLSVWHCYSTFKFKP